MAETDGTPRYRKSKPPKGGSGSGTPTRNSKPGSRARKRAALRETLQNGSVLETTPENPPEAAALPTAQTVRPKPPALPNGVVMTTMPTVIRSEPVARRDEHEREETADTYADMRSTNARSTAPLPGGTPAPQPEQTSAPPPVRTIRPALGSTLRMELTVLNSEGSEPRFQVRPTSPLGLGSDATPGSTTLRSGPTSDFLPSGHPTSPEGWKRSRKPTTPGFAPAFPDPSGRPKFYTGAGSAERTGRFNETLRSGANGESDSDDAGFYAKPGSTNPSLSGATATGEAQRPRRPRRPGERTLIMTRRPKKGSKRDWVFVVLLVAALGLTASMFLSQQAPAEEVVDASAYDDPQYQEESQDPFAQTTLRPWKEKEKEKDTPQKAVPSQSDTNAVTAREPTAAANSVQATELRSMPAGAEVIAGNAVVGSTPVRVARGSADMNYVLRLPGHESKTVRVGPHSPASILVELGSLSQLAPKPAPAAAPPPSSPMAPRGR